MDFLDPKKQRASEIRLKVGYVLIAIAIALATYIVMLVAAYGFGIDKGQVVQNGFLFVSSHPAGSSILLNGKADGTTNTRLALQAGTYNVVVKRAGYLSWKRTITIEGDSVVRFDYPFLFPSSLKTTSLQNYASVPVLATQSPNRRWLLVEPAGSSELGKFQLYDLNKDPTTSPLPAIVDLPSGILTTATTKAPQALSVVSWSDDNQHVLLKHTFDKKTEYILLATQNPSQSVNLNKALKNNPTTLMLENKKYNQYFVYSSSTQQLATASLNNPTLVPMLQHVLAFQTYGDNVVLYATAQGAPAGQAEVHLFQNGQDYFVRNIAASSTYLLDLTQYSGSWYIVAGSSAENRVYVYQNPLDVLAAHDGSVLVPVAVLKVADPTYASFSDSAQFIVAENGTNFAAYDVQYQNAYNYTINAPMDKPQQDASWMDGDRLTYVSEGKLIVFDYDGKNQQTLMPADPNLLPFFDQNYKYVYTFAPTAATSKTPTGSDLTYTALLTPADL